jgi:hypothetical protein
MVIGGDVYLINHALRWVYDKQINHFQPKSKILRDLYTYLTTPDIPPSKLIFDNQVKQTTGNFGRSKDEIMLSLTAKKILIQQQNLDKSRNGTNVSSNNVSGLRISTDSTVYNLNNTQEDTIK